MRLYFRIFGQDSHLNILNFLCKHDSERAQRLEKISKTVAFWSAFRLIFYFFSACKTSVAELTFLYAFCQNEYFAHAKKRKKWTLCSFIMPKIKKKCNKFLTEESLELKAKYLHEIFKMIETLYRYDIWEISQWYFQWPLFQIFLPLFVRSFFVWVFMTQTVFRNLGT